VPKSFYFPIHSGILTPHHKEKIGPALWEFLWLISKTTKEIDKNGEKTGIVLGGRPIKFSEIADDIGSSESTVKRNIARLKEQNYIEVKRAPYGDIYFVKKSKKFNKRQTKNDLSDDRDRPFLNERQTKNDLSNKDIKDIKSKDKKIYLDLPIQGNVFLEIYNQQFFNKFGKQHMQITEEQQNIILEQIHCMEEFIDHEEFDEIVYNHFENLPKSNNGNILAFIPAFKRYLNEIRNYGG
jgi:DNA-binding transcriptional regulator YhcF (GntR family)